MKFIVSFPNDKKLLLSAQQLEVFISVIDGVEMLVDKHVGANQGTHGYSNSYIHAIEIKRTAEWFTATPVAEDYLDTIRLAAKLEKPSE